jgi:hypothetical protein
MSGITRHLINHGKVIRKKECAFALVTAGMIGAWSYV